MTAQAGQDVLIQIDMNGADEFETIAGLRASKISFNAQSVNATNLSSPGRWRELIEGAGIRSANINGSGVFIDDATESRIQQQFFSGKILKLRMRLPNFGDIIGKFQISSMEFSGNYDGEANYDFSFTSAGELIFMQADLN